ncbi:uncharacterized protein LOC135837220 isoform X2 [Planococcus citri]|uniref:uncharacterized protein LOC135837220 isoform X2 n=1 Tax=Planococcus citri TaxID=170843 RepID=UPI0031F823B3
MRRLSFVLIFYYLRSVYVSNPENSVESLVEIESSEALPIVLYDVELMPQPQPPERVDSVVIENGRLVGGTQFGSIYAGQQSFYCPVMNSLQNCLIRTDFQTGEPLQCAQQALPTLNERSDRKNSSRCGLNKVGTLYHFTYELCNSFDLNEYPLQPMQPLSVYTLCFDLNEDKVLFTSHRILFAPLISSKALKQENKVVFPITSIDKFIPYNYDELKAALIEESNSQILVKKSAYRTQKLVPSEDMVFALWRQPTFQFLNLELQHVDLFELWNEVNGIIRSYADTMFTNNRSWTYVMASVFDLPSKLIDLNGQKPNIWAKIILSMKSNQNKKPMRAAVILMENFIHTTNTISLKRELEISEYCKEDSCDDNLLKTFQNFEGHLHCCSLTEKMKEMFDLQEFHIDNKSMLYIPGLNKIFEPMDVVEIID